MEEGPAVNWGALAFAAIAQLVERFLGKEEVPGSNPGGSSNGGRRHNRRNGIVVP